MVKHLTLHCGIKDTAHRNCLKLLNNVIHVANKDRAEFRKALQLFSDKLNELIKTTSIFRVPNFWWSTDIWVLLGCIEISAF
jgi:hypothetical protein